MKAQNKNSYRGVLYLFLGEIIASILIIVGYLCYYSVVGLPFKWQVISGALLGSIVTTFNFFLLSVQVNAAINEYIALRGDREMTEEEATEFAKAHTLKVKNAVAKSYVLRTALMIGTLVIAFITSWFEPLATLIPLLLYKPLIYIVELINKKRGE